MTLTAEQLEARKTGIGGSDAGAVCGFGYKTPLDVYLRLVEGREPDLSSKEAVEWGNRLEAAVADAYQDRTGKRLRRVNRTLRHQAMPWMIAHPDRLIVGEHAGLEIKTAGHYARERWGPSGTDEVPEEYILQCLHYMIVTGCKEWHLAALIAGQELRIYHIPFRPELAELVIDRERAFWHDHVLPEIPPAPTSGGEVLQLNPTDSGRSVVADSNIASAIEALRAVRAEIKAHEARKTELEDQIKAYMGDAAALTDADGRAFVTWKAGNPQKQTDWQAIAKGYLASLSDDERERVLVDHTSTKPGARRFLVK